MTVKELIELLKEQNPEALVVISKDCEADRYSPMSRCFADSCWVGAVFVFCPND